MNKTYYMLATLALSASCAQQAPKPTASPTNREANAVRAHYVDSTDARRVRTPDYIKTYHIGRTTDRSGRTLHEAHRVYELGQTSGWNLQRNQPSLASSGPIRALRDQAYRPLPADRELEAEKNRQRELTREMAKAKAETQELLDRWKDRGQAARGDATAMADLRRQLEQERALRLQAESRLPKQTDEFETTPEGEALRRWGSDLENDRDKSKR